MAGNLRLSFHYEEATEEIVCVANQEQHIFDIDLKISKV